MAMRHVIQILVDKSEFHGTLISKPTRLHTPRGFLVGFCGHKTSDFGKISLVRKFKRKKKKHYIEKMSCMNLAATP